MLQRAWILLSWAFLPVCLVLGFAWGRHSQLPESMISSFAAQSTPLPPGPWGELRYVPMTIAAPEQMLPVRSIESGAARWWFEAVTPECWKKFLDGLDLTSALRQQLNNPPIAQFQPRGLMVTPSSELLFELPTEARSSIYLWIARFPQNEGQLVFVPADDVEERFQQCRVSSMAAALFSKLSCPYGHYRVMAGLPTLLAALPTYEEKAHFMKALTRQKTLMLRMHITPTSDLNEVVAYWGRGCWNTDVQAMLESLARTPKGLWVDILELLPPLPTGLLYTFPQSNNPLNGPPQRRDCHWTTFNFFRDQPDPRTAYGNHLFELLKQDYSQVAGDPRFGDAVLFAKPDGSIIHSAVFLAGDVVFTKNGATPIHPWMLSTIPDLLEQYSFQVAPDEKLTVLYYRSKSL